MLFSRRICHGFVSLYLMLQKEQTNIVHEMKFDYFSFNLFKTSQKPCHN